MLSAARAIEHPQVSRVLGVAQVDGAAFVASPLAPGVSAFELSQASEQAGGALDEDLIVRIAHDALVVCKELRASGARGRDEASDVHRETVWLTDEGTFLLMEVGIASWVLARTGDDDERLQQAPSGEAGAGGSPDAPSEGIGQSFGHETRLTNALADGSRRPLPELP